MSQRSRSQSLPTGAFMGAFERSQSSQPEHRPCRRHTGAASWRYPTQVISTKCWDFPQRTFILARNRPFRMPLSVFRWGSVSCSPPLSYLWLNVCARTLVVDWNWIIYGSLFRCLSSSLCRVDGYQYQQSQSGKDSRRTSPGCIF